MTKTKPFNLDTIENDDAKAEPFAVTLGGEKFTLRDVRDVDYREMIAAYEAAKRGDVGVLVSLVIGVDDREAFDAHDMSGRQLEALFAAYNEHYGIVAAQAHGGLRSVDSLAAEARQ